MVLDNGNSGKKRSVIVVVLTLIAVSVLVGSAFGDYTPEYPDGVYPLENGYDNDINSRNMFTNPTFGGSFDGWSEYSCGGQASIIGGNTAYSDYAYSMAGSNSSSEYGWAELSQVVNLTDVNEITLDIALNNYQNINNSVNFGYILIGGTQVKYTVDSGTTKYSNLNIGAIFGGLSTGTYHTLHIDTSSYTAENTFNIVFKVYALNNGEEVFSDNSNLPSGLDVNGIFSIVGVKTTNYSALNPYESPTLDNVTSKITATGQDTSEYMINSAILDDTSVTFNISFTVGYPATTYIGYSVNDYGTEYATWIQATTSPFQLRLTPSTGLSSYYIYAKNSAGYYAQSAWAFNIEKYGIDITANTADYPTPPVKVHQNQDVNLISTGSTANIYADESTTPIWYVRPSGGSWTSVKKGWSSTQWNVSGSSLYDIMLSGQTSSGKKFSVDSTSKYPNGIINSVAAYVKFDKTSYTTSDQAKISWDLGLEYQTGHTYNLYVFSCSDVTGTDPSLPALITKTSIPSSGEETVNCVAFPSGHVGAYIYDVTSSFSVYSPLVHTVGVPITVIGKLKFTITNESATWTQPTTVTLYDSTGSSIVGGLDPSNPITNITTGECTFDKVVSPNHYIVKAVTEGYNITYPINFEIATGGLTDEINLDFTNGGGSSETVGGSGSMYASTYVTFRVIDSGTGGYVEGVYVSGYAESATNPVEWIGNLFGQSWGGKIQGSTVSGTTDKDGKITFAMFPVYKYRLTLKYYDKTWTYTFTPTELTTEEIISLPISEAISKETATQLVVTAVEPDNSNGKINIYYEDMSNNGAGSTEKVVIRVFSIDENGEKKAVILDKVTGDTEMVISGMQEFDPPISLQMEKWQRNSFWVEMDCYVGAFYPSVDHSKPSVSRSGGVTFSGMRIQIGSIPEGFYLIISFGILVMLGAIGTQVTSRFYAIIVAVVGLFLWWAGWMSALGVVGEIACVLAFVLAILYYIAGVNQPQ